MQTIPCKDFSNENYEHQICSQINKNISVYILAYVYVHLPVIYLIVRMYE